MKKNILVTGGNRGIGLEICRQLALLGHMVYMGCRDVKVAQKQIATMKGDIYPIKLDVTQPDYTARPHRNEHDHIGNFNVLINNAGVISSNAGVSNMSMEEYHLVLKTNLEGPLNMMKMFLPFLKASTTESRIINMSSSMGAHENLSSGSHAAYRLSKAALNDLTMLMAADLAEHNIAVNAMDPGWVQTDMGGLQATRTVAEGADTAVWLATADKIPTGKFFRDRTVIPW